MWFWILFAFVVVQRLTELVIARRNERWMKARGGIEMGHAHYKWMVCVHVLFLISLLVEVQVFGARSAAWWWAPLAVFVAAQVMRFWALFSLGPYWNTKIIVVAGADVIAKGPYRFLRHPNYVIVAAEILTLPLIFQAYVTAVVFTFLNIVVMRIRIPVEEKALSETTDYRSSTGKRPRFFP